MNIQSIDTNSYFVTNFAHAFSEVKKGLKLLIFEFTEFSIFDIGKIITTTVELTH